MTGEQTQALIGMGLTFAILVVMVLPSLFGIVRERRIDREITRARRALEAQRSAERPTGPAAATRGAAVLLHAGGPPRGCGTERAVPAP
ncbi:hypothetical protein AB0G32_11005 [Streptomyces sp. NPDC023723]|uniref:hypothetical protein n=1 Tax=Streptomyces sp. NPDC023723 TaxID=3154323 RepID=UPI0033EC4A4E